MSDSEHFISTGDWSPQTLDRVLQLAMDVKSSRGRVRAQGRGLGLIFFNPSLRTRTSFQVAMTQLGGHSVVLEVGGGVWDLEFRDGVVMDGSRAEHVREAAPVLARYLDGLAVRCFGSGQDWNRDRKDEVVQAFAKHAGVPVINMESSLWHPCQALADALTWKELGLEQGSKIVLSWAYHPRALPTAVPNSVALMAAQRGLDLHLLHPPEFDLDPDVMTGVTAAAEQTGGTVTTTTDRNCLEGAKVVYAKSWGSLQHYGDAESEKKIRDEYRSWQVTEEWLEQSQEAHFMHCLPVRRNVVVTDEVLDSPRSAVIQQAENRLHAQKALLGALLGENSDLLEEQS